MRGKAAESRGRLIGRVIVLGIIAVGGLAAFFFLAPHFFHAETDVPLEQLRKETLSPTLTFVGRKNIYDRNFRALAVSFRLTSVYARPLEIREPKSTASRLAEVLGLDENALLAAIKAERSFVWIGRHISPKKAEAITALNLKGVHMIHEVQRFYPNHTTASHVVGFMKDEQGLAGIESFYDNVLRGSGFQDSGPVSALLPTSVAKGGTGAHLVLTLDLEIQQRLEKQLAALVKKTGAQTAMSAVMRIEDGSILGLANFPTYDLNLFWDYGAAQRKNRMVSDRVHPGAIHSLFRLAAALDQGKSLESIAMATISSEPRKGESPSDLLGEWLKVSEDVYVSRELDMVHRQADDKVGWRAYAEEIGLTTKTGIDLPEEELTNTSSDMGEGATGYDFSAQGAPTTALSLLTAFSRLINGGKGIRPHLLDALWDSDEFWRMEYGDNSSESPVRPEVSHALLSILKNSTSPKAKEALYLESAVVANPPAQAGGSAYQGNNDDQEAKPRFHAVLLGTAPRQFPEIALIIVLDRAQLNLTESSPLREMAKGLVGRARKIARRKTPETSGPVTPGEDEYYVKWQALQTKSDDRAMLRRDLQKETMPDLRGYSLRKALQALQEYGLRVTVSGSGKVVGQHPAPGASLRGVEECNLQLRMDN